MTIRQPAVAGQFYEASSYRLRAQIKALLPAAVDKTRAMACLLPHAGYMYSGRVAAETVAGIDIPDKIVLLGPNHTGNGEPLSIMAEGAWLTPLGKIEIDAVLASEILRHAGALKNDSLAHLYEHSLEVELPFLQYFRSSFKIVPIAFMTGNLTYLKQTGIAIAKVIKEQGLGSSTLIVASSDMTHYEPQAAAETKDKQAIQAIVELDEDKLVELVRRLDISMCGAAPAVAMISAARELGAKKAKLIKYETSGDVTGDKESVVGYAGIRIE